MVRSVTKKYQVWIAGYYDDFNGARAIADDLNKPSDASYSVLKSHFGNPMNGEAFMNPRFRFSVEEREDDDSLTSGNRVAIDSGANENRYLQNDGIFEWLTFDDIRLSRDEWEGRIQLQYPDGHVANRYKFDNDSDYTEDYVRFVNGHDTTSSYLVPTGDNDATFGRSDMKEFDSQTVSGGNYVNKIAGCHNDDAGDFIQRAHLTGVWTGEQLAQTHNSTTPLTLFAEVKSPAGKPFLCVQSSRKAKGDSSNKPAIIYDGPLNTRIDGDIFTARIAVRTMKANNANWTDAKVLFEIGFPSAQAGIKTTTGYTGVPAIEYRLDLSGISYDDVGLLYDSSGSLQSYNNDDAWIDVDFVFDYSAGTYDVYANGASVTTGGSLLGGGTVTPSDLYGYQISVIDQSGSTDDNGWVSYLMLDRAGLVRYLTDDITTTDEVQIEGLSLRQPVNGVSVCDVKITDDPKLTSYTPYNHVGVRGTQASDYLLNLRSLFVSSSPLNWNVLVFADNTGRIDRPIWRGEVKTFDISQKSRGRTIRLLAEDSLGSMNNQIPLWDVGQKAVDDEEEAVDYWNYDSQGLRKSMFLGAKKLLLLDGDLGFDTDSTYRESATQRTQLGSGHPIQMYNNENTIYGPNNIEDEYEGVAILGFTEEAGSTSRTEVHLSSSSHGITTSSSVNIINSDGHNATGIQPQSVSTANNIITFNAADLAYVPESAKIVYIGKYPGLRGGPISMNPNVQGGWPVYNSLHPNTSDLPSSSGPYSTYVYFDADPSLVPGDYFFINNRNMAHTTNLSSSYRVRHRVEEVVRINSYFETNTFSIATNTGYIWIVKVNTPYDSSAEGTHGVYATSANTSSDTLLATTLRFEWCRDTGQTKGVFPTYDLSNRVLHARWMRDLPMSLWFQYRYGRIKQDYVNSSLPSGVTITQHNLILGTQTLSPSTTNIKVSQKTYEAIPQYGVAEIWKAPALVPYNSDRMVYQEKFIYQGKVISGGNYYLVGVKYINGTYNAVSTSSAPPYYYLRVQDIGTNDGLEDYKHIWLLWSDMRNNGNANADALTRTQDFGLQYPVSDNYDIQMFFADQYDSEGKLDAFASLNIGEDVEVWNVDATHDPITKGPFSKPADYANPVSATIGESGGKLTITISSSDMTNRFPSTVDYVHLVGTTSHDGMHTISSRTSTVLTTATTHSASTYSIGGEAVVYASVGSDADLSAYHDWENEAGAFLVIDSSRFFNLNTYTNNGRSGLVGGGRTDLSDYIAVNEGNPALIDNYWAEGISSYKTTPDELGKHPAQYRLISDATLATDGFVDGYIGLPVDDATIFDESGVGKLRAIMSRSNTSEKVIEYYFVWNGKLESEYSSSTGIDATITDLTFEGQTAVQINNTGETHSTSGLKEGMVLKRTPSGGGDVTVHTILEVDSNTRLTVTGTSSVWATGDTYTVPAQLAMVYAVDMDDITEGINASSGLSTLENEIWSHYHSLTLDWSNRAMSNLLGSTTDTTPEAYEVHATVASDFMLRLLMYMKGYVKSKNSGTYWNSDKIRMLWNTVIMDTWLPSSKLTCMYDINNVPNTYVMANYNSTSNSDSYGSMVDVRGKSLGNIITHIQETSSVGEGGTDNSFTYRIGRDNRFEFRPKYDSGLVFNRDNIMISNIRASMAKQITNVRVYYNNGGSFADWPSTALTDTTTWRIKSFPNITSSEEALIVAKQIYNKAKNNPLKLTVEPILESDVVNKLTDDGRYGYVADPYIALNGNDDHTGSKSTMRVCNWTLLGTGGALFPGMVNGLNGNMNIDVDPLDTRYGTSRLTTASSTDIPWHENYYWYGSNSISHAVQIVHVTNGTPLTNSNGHSMRMVVDLKNQTGTSIEDAEFVVKIADYNYTNDRDRILSNPSSSMVSTKDVKHSGFYEIDIPSTYSAPANAKIVFSFNAEYCRSLLRHRCGDPSKTDSSVGDATHSVDANYYILDSSVSNGSGAINKNSIFPLGLREYEELGGGFRDERKWWYAPRVHICRDLSYVPGTYCSVTDKGLEMTNETMVIKDVDMSLSAGSEIEKLSLSLERDEAITDSGLIPYLFNNNSGGVQTGSDIGTVTPIDPVNENEPDYTPPSDNFPDVPLDPGLQDALDNAVDQSSTFTTRRKTRLSQVDGASYGKLKGRMSLLSDNLSAGSRFSILGMQKPSSIPYTMRGIEGMDTDIRATSGTACVTGDGYVFSGKGLQGGEYSASRESSIETTFVVPRDVMSNRINIQSTVTHSPIISETKTAVLYVTVTIEETNTSITHTVKLGTGIEKKIISLLPNTALDGLDTQGNHIKVNITRKAGTGDDDADTSSVTLHNIEVKMQRASAHTKSQADRFSTF